MEKSISDETLLKELNLLDKEITIYDILSLIIVVEQKESNPYGEFKCYFKNETKEFYIEINESTPIKVFTRSILLNLFDFAEKKGAKIIYVCLRNTANDISCDYPILIFIRIIFTLKNSSLYPVFFVCGI